MKRSLLRIALASGVLVPLVCSAAFLAPSDLLYALHLQRPAMDYSYEFHGSHKQYYAAAWISGNEKSGPWSDMLANAKVTIDVAGEGATMRMKLQVRIKDGNAYFFIENVDGKYENEAAILAGQYIGKQWIVLPLDEAGIGNIDQSKETFMAFDKIFSLQSAGTTKGTEHTLTFKREVVKEIMKSLRQMNMSMGATPKVSFVMNVQTNANEQPVSLSFDADIGNELFTVTGTGKATQRSTPVTVEIPANAVNMQEAMENFRSFDLPANPFGIPMDMNDSSPDWSEDDGNDEEWHAPMDIDSEDSMDWSEPAPDEDCATNLSLLQKGYCGAVRPSTR